MKELISVIIPCYNSSLTIERAVKSVLHQSYNQFEILIVDDASSDSVLLKNIIDSFKDKRIRYFRHEKNKNGSGARNTGIENSNGMFIAFLDSDDEWYSVHLEMSLQEWNKKQSQTNIVYCRNLVKTKNHADIVMPQNGIGNDEKVSDYLFCNSGYISTPSLFAYAKAMKENLFDESLIRHQDYELILRLESKGFRFILSEHNGVIVHWENLNTEIKGGTADFSLSFAKKYDSFFTAKAYSNFILKNVVFPKLIKKERSEGWRIFRKETRLKYLGIKNAVFLFDYYIWGKLKMVKLMTQQ